MRITKFHTMVAGTPWRNLSYVFIETDEGIEGCGEARVLSKTHTVLEYLKDVKRHITGQDVFDIEDLYLRFTLLDFGVPGEVTMTGLALIEMACWDCIGKKLGMPVYKLLGGKVRDKIPAYANGWYTGERTPEDFAARARTVIEAGYKGLKFDPFGAGNLELSRNELFLSISLIEAVRDAAGPEIDLYIEMHGRFAPHQAVQIAKEIEDFSPSWIEEPCRPEDLDALDYVKSHCSIPIATGERLYNANQFRELFNRRACHIIQPDLNQCGGFLETKKICSTAETYSMTVAPHNVGGVITTVASLHLLAGLRNGKVLEHFNDFADNEVKKIGSPYPEVQDGYFSIPDAPGWGVEIDKDYLLSLKPEHRDGIIHDPGLGMFEKENWSRRGQGKG